MNLSDKLKELRRTKNVSQEKLAEYLGVSYQAVSKWENSITSPDILLLPDIARYFGITVDELLQVEKIEADKYFEECSLKAEALYRNGLRAEIIPLWQEAYKKLPNDIRVKVMLMSIYFDTNKVKYQNEIIELGTEIYNSDTTDGCYSYYQGQAIDQIARTYYEIGNAEKAHEWMCKAHQLNHCQELLIMQIHDEEDWLTGTFSFANHFYLQTLFYMSQRLAVCNVKCFGEDYVKKVYTAVAEIFELVCPNDDMSYEFLRNLCSLHHCIAESEIYTSNDEGIVKKHIARAIECALKSAGVKRHKLTHPLLYDREIEDAPSDNMQIVRALKNVFAHPVYDEYRNKGWFINLNQRLEIYQ